MTSSRIVRGTKGRLFGCLGVLTIFAGVIFLYHSTRVELDEVRNSLSKCRQEQDSLAAQIQVISEYKKNLEKSLNQEKAEHRQTKEELQSRMNDEQQLRTKENLENVNKYKALQQQYKLLQSEHEDLNELLNKAKTEQTSCAESVSHLEAQLAVIHQDQSTKDAETNTLKMKFLQLEEENKLLFQKLNSYQNNLEVGLDDKDKNFGKRSSTRQTDAIGANGDTGGEPPHDVLPIAQKSSTAAQDEILQPARPAQPGLLQSALSQTSGKQSTTPQVNAEALQGQVKALPRPIPALPLPLMLSPLQQHASVEKQDFVNNGPQGVLPAPLGFGSDNQYVQQNAVPLQAPYRLHGLGHQEIPQNQGQMPPIAPVAAIAAVQNNVLQAPPDHIHDISQHSPNFNVDVHQNMNPFRNERNVVNHPEVSQHKLIHSPNVYNLNGIKAHDVLNNIYNIPKNNGAQGKHVVLVHGNQFERAANVAPYHKSGMKNIDIVPLDGDVNQHPVMDVHGGNPFVELGQHGPDAAHGKFGALPVGQQEAHQAGHYQNYQGGDYDKEDPPANNEGEEEDLDQIDYNNNEPNQAHPPHQINPGLQVPKVVHRRLVDRHQDGVMVNPR